MNMINILDGVNNSIFKILKYLDENNKNNNYNFTIYTMQY